MEINALKLRELREDATLSTRELAERAGIDHTTIIRLEGGQSGAHPRTIRKLADALAVTPKELRKAR
jgi:transcriptional regulator with XRE-family HTH domain